MPVEPTHGHITVVPEPPADREVTVRLEDHGVQQAAKLLLIQDRPKTPTPQPNDISTIIASSSGSRFVEASRGNETPTPLVNSYKNRSVRGEGL